MSSYSARIELRFTYSGQQSMGSRAIGSKLLALLLTSSCTQMSTPLARAEVDPRVHEACLKAADYMGCVNAQTNGIERTERKEEECDSTGACIAGKGEDRLGLPKIAGWKYTTLPDGTVIYYEIIGAKKREGQFASAYKYIPHKKGKRYIGRRMVVHWYDPGAAGTPGYTTSYGGGNTTCSSYGGYGSVQTFCNTSQPIKTYIPGRPGRAAGARSMSGVNVLDCKDKTSAFYEDGKNLRGNWKKVDIDIDFVCREIDEMPVLQMSL